MFEPNNSNDENNNAHDVSGRTPRLGKRTCPSKVNVLFSFWKGFYLLVSQPYSEHITNKQYVITPQPYLALPLLYIKRHHLCITFKKQEKNGFVYNRFRNLHAERLGLLLAVFQMYRLV